MRQLGLSFTRSSQTHRAEFGHTNGRNFLYPGFLYLILSVFADFRAITFVQHLLGLTAGAFFYSLGGALEFLSQTRESVHLFMALWGWPAPPFISSLPKPLGSKHSCGPKQLADFSSALIFMFSFRSLPVVSWNAEISGGAPPMLPDVRL